VPVHARARHGFDVLDFDYPVDPEFYSGGHGLYATAADFAAVQQLLLNRGELRGVRLLEPATVDLMTRDHLDGLPIERARSIRPQFSYDLDPGPGVTWGLETMITVDSRPGRRPARSFGWCGTFNTFYWIDPVNQLVAAIYMQTLPFLDPAAVELADAFEEAVYA
jgi:CubicO group peptidase (beta-lactamase class C family)